MSQLLAMKINNPFKIQTSDWVLLDYKKILNFQTHSYQLFKFNRVMFGAKKNRHIIGDHRSKTPKHTGLSK